MSLSNISGKAFRSLSEGSVASYLKHLDLVPLLTPSEESELIKRVCGGDESAREHLVLANLRLVVSIAKRYARFTDEDQFIDLIQSGNIGLIRAVDLVDSTRENRFSAYAVPWIRQHVFRALNEEMKFMRIPRHIAGAIMRCEQAERELQAVLQRDPFPEEVAAVLGVDVDEVLFLETISQRTLSLESPLFSRESDSAIKVSDGIPDTTHLSAHQIAELNSQNTILSAVVARLKPRDQELVARRYGFNGYDDHTLDGIGQEFGGLTRERVRQIEARILSQLRKDKSIVTLRKFA